METNTRYIGLSIAIRGIATQRDKTPWDDYDRTTANEIWVTVQGILAELELRRAKLAPKPLDAGVEIGYTVEDARECVTERTGNRLEPS